MKAFTSTKIVLFLSLLSASFLPAPTVSAQVGCPDPNCCKVCGMDDEIMLAERNCATGGTCYVTICMNRSSQCTSGTANINDSCSGWFCVLN